MEVQILQTSAPTLQKNPTFFNHHLPLFLFTPHFQNILFPTNLCISAPRIRRNRFLTSCIAYSQEVIDDVPETSSENGGQINMGFEEEGETVKEVEKQELGNQTIWNQMKDIVMFTGPATGLWICGPLMSLIDTAVIGQGSSIELAALGPATVVCDNMSYVFMFLSIATSNMVATALAKQDRKQVQHHISILLFVGLTCGFFMLLFTKFFGSWILTAFTGPQNVHVVPAANTYVQIRGLAWPALLVGWVAQSASVINGIGDVVLCSLLGYGIAGAAWATMASQVVAGYMMIESLNKIGYNAFAIAIPSPEELLKIIGLAAPVFVTMMSKVAFYSLLVYFATSMGTHTMAAHQARMLLKSLVIIGAITGFVLGIVGTSVPLFFPNIFTPDPEVIQKMHRVLIPYFIALAVTPATHSLEGTLLAGRDLRFLSLSMSGCFTVGALLLLIMSNIYGLPGCWSALAGFQWVRFLLALGRLLSPNSILYSEDLSQYKLKTV
ncbi:Protein DETOXIFICATION [Quillaja saponaria]|uniref:Protein DETOXIFICATION n=1 Tax=Quillaja saponaria TaxID=32244 RepID=A0AAD7QC24_QUISA|nr:Protein DETOXIFICATION [Quillaja saponaria]